MPEVSSRPPPRHRTLLLGIVLVAFVLSFFHRFAPAGISADLATAFHASAAALGVLAGTYFAIYTLMQIPTGVLVDTVGPRRILLWGGAVATLGSLLFGLAWSLEVALVGRTLVGLGVSVVFIAMLKLIALWYDERQFATVVGLALLIGNTGSLLAGTPLNLLAEAISWRGVFYVAATVSLLSTLALFFSLPREPQVAGTLPADRSEIVARLLDVLRNRATWPSVLANFGIAGSFFALAGLWATPYLMHVHGMSALQASYHLSTYVGGFAVGAVTLGTLSDRLARRKPVILGATLVCSAITLLLASGVPLRPTASLPLMLALGFSTAGFTLSWTCVKEVNPPEFSGMSTSVANMAGFLAAAMLQPGVGHVMGMLWDGTVNAAGVPVYTRGNYLAGMSVIASFTLLGTFACFFVRETHGRNIWQPRT